MKRLVTGLAILTATLMLMPSAASSSDVTVDEYPPGEVPDTIWSWWIHPLALADGDDVLVGGLAEDVVKVWRIEPDRMLEASWPAVGGDDDHNAPAIAVHPTEPALVFYAGHNNEDRVYYRTLDRDMTVSEQQYLETPGVATYAQALTYGDTVVLFTRAAKCRWYAAVSHDWGTVWGDWIEVVDGCADGGLTYLTTAPAPSLGDGYYRIAVYGHPSASDWREIDTGLLNLATGRISEVDDWTVANLYTGGSLPIQRGSRLSTAYDPPTGTVTRLLDLGESATGDPLVAFATWNDWDIEGTGRYHTARYDQAQGWVVADSLPGTGSPFQNRHSSGGRRGYVGGMAITQSGDVVLSREVKIDGGASQWRVERYRIDNGWKLVASEQFFTPLVRPYAVRSSNSVVVHRLNRYPGVDADALLDPVPF